jgi:Mlc titration factor MtfA (ptsG expression regulator)
MFQWLRQQRRKRTLARSDTSVRHWARAWDGLSLLSGMGEEEALRLRKLATIFLAEKTVSPAQDIRITLGMRQFIALQACLPILGLDADWYRSWYSIVLYPDTFVSSFDAHDETGVVHRVREPRMGESWDQGPLILSWQDTLASGEFRDGYNVVVHECAHKLDALDGAANGKPPLHAGMSIQQWADVFGSAYDNLCAEVAQGVETRLDPYAAEGPEEFFAVLSEAFFEVPDTIVDTFPDCYDQLRRFYRQDPLSRLRAVENAAA